MVLERFGVDDDETLDADGVRVAEDEAEPLDFEVEKVDATFD